MQRREELDALASHRADLRALGVRSLAVFGSTARGTATPESDVDLLVEFEGETTFDRYITLKLYLEDLLKRPVDLVTRKALRPALRPYVEADALYVA
ncbi:MAG: nucleotidyltransferase family protein [Chloroflexi bacterium]|nr:nucleotidyltransferase family protein [Chloroflexota bacterium]